MAGRIRRRALAKALSLAEMQGEEAALKRALRLVRAYERGINKKERSQRSRRFNDGRGSEPYMVVEAKTATITERKELGDVLAVIKYKFQAALRRYLLLKNACARFSLPCTRDAFIKIFSGHANIQGRRVATGEELIVSLENMSQTDVMNKITNILGEKDDRWCRRYYGRTLFKRREVAYVDYKKDVLQRSKIRFRLCTREIKQLDHEGQEIITSCSFLQGTFPRNTTTVRPSKELRDAVEAAGRRPTKK